MLKVIFMALSLCVALPVFTGCQGTIPAQTGSTLEKNWGTAFESSKYNQIINPEAGKNTAPVEGLDGQAAEKNVKKYRDSFEKPARKESVPLVGLGLGLPK
ncbi:MAG: hypothetical protein JSV50_05465 [Desulfobacteraceae bacterium]|nr:MAG: hypothetical protein JSV50_05465 [Desulfobacteraceae bacterium]